MVQWPTNKTCLTATDQLIADQCEQTAPSGHWSVGIAHSSFAEYETADDFLFWFPWGIPNGRSVTVASSRMSRKLDEQTDWLDAIRTLAVHTAKQPEFLITASGTTTDEFVRRLAELFQIASLEFRPFPKRPAIEWFVDQAESAEGMSAEAGPRFLAFFKPLQQSGRDSKPSVDELLIGLAKSTVLLSVRKNGNIHRSAQQRLAKELKPGTRLLISHKLTPKSVQSDLLQRGATAWWLYEPNPTEPAVPRSQTSASETRKPNATILSVDEIKPQDYLAHWTRRRVGPWPDQTNSEYLDDLIFRTSRCKHNEISALCRILALGRILGSHDLTRDRRDVVCFSNLPLDEIPNRRVFRPHLSRWDFEPFGLAVDRETLIRLGAQPVIYGDESDWIRLSDSERAFFQIKTSQSAEIDWSEEREWRIVGDLKLDEIPVEKAVVFVKSESDALIVADLSRWPIVVLEQCE